MPAAVIKLDTAPFLRNLRSQRAGIEKRMLRAAKRNLLEGRRFIVKNYMTTQSTVSLGRRTGRLVRNLHTRIRTKSGRNVLATGEVFFRGRKANQIAYAHDEGITIRPKRGKYLHFKGSRGWARVKRVKLRRRRFFTRGWERWRNQGSRLLIRDWGRALDGVS